METRTFVVPLDTDSVPTLQPTNPLFLVFKHYIPSVTIIRSQILVSLANTFI